MTSEGNRFVVPENIYVCEDCDIFTEHSNCPNCKKEIKLVDEN